MNSFIARTRNVLRVLGLQTHKLFALELNGHIFSMQYAVFLFYLFSTSLGGNLLNKFPPKLVGFSQPNIWLPSSSQLSEAK